MFYDYITVIYLALLHICSTPIGPGLPSSAALLFNRSTGGILEKLNMPPILFNLKDAYYYALIKINSIFLQF